MSATGPRGPFEESGSIRQFQDRIAAYQRAGGGEAALWLAIEDIGKQVSNVRHELPEIRQDIERVNTRLFGYSDDPDLVRGGMLGVLTRKIEEQSRTTRARTEQLTNEQTTELKVNQRWVLAILGAVGALGMGIAGYVIEHWIHP